MAGPCRSAADQRFRPGCTNAAPIATLWALYLAVIVGMPDPAGSLGVVSRYGAEMAKKKAASAFEYVEPIGDRVLVRKDEPKRETRGGIALPDAAEIPTITGRIVTISAVVENDEELPLRQYDKILFHPKNAVPVDLEHDNQLFVVPVEDIVAVFRRNKPEED